MKSKRSRAWQKRQLVKRIAEKLSNRPQRHIVSYEELESAIASLEQMLTVPPHSSVIVMNEEDIAELKSRNTDAWIIDSQSKAVIQCLPQMGG